MITHELELDINFCDDVFSGRQNFEIRNYDRGFQTGDHIKFIPKSGMLDVLHEISEKEYEITYILYDRGLKEGYIALGFKACS